MAPIVPSRTKSTVDTGGADDGLPRSFLVGAEQPDSQLMVADQRGLRSLDARRSEHTILAWNHPCIEQQEIDRLTPLDQFGECGLNAGRRVQVQLQRREDFFLISAAS